MPGQEDAAAPDAVGDAADRDGEAEIGHRGAQEEQREPLDVEVGLALDDEIDERVADRQQPQPGAHERDDAKARDPEQARCAERRRDALLGAAGAAARRPRARGCGGSRRRAPGSPAPISAIEKETRKTVLYWPGAGASRTKAASGPSIAPTVSSARCTPKERPAGALAVERDQCVARSGADALAEAVDEQDGASCPATRRPRRRGRACTAPTRRSRGRRPPCGAPCGRPRGRRAAARARSRPGTCRR